MKSVRRSRRFFSVWGFSAQGRQRPRARAYRLGLEPMEGRALLSVALVSMSAPGATTASGDSDFETTSQGGEDYSGAFTQTSAESLSSDGTMLVYVSDAPETGAGGSASSFNQASNVYVRDMATGTTTLVSATASGQAANGDSFDPVISPNGRYVAFVSDATNMTATAGASNINQQNGVGDLYIRDLDTDTTTLLDQTPAGALSDGFSTGQFVFSPDSGKLAWFDSSDDLTTAAVDPLSRPDDTGTVPDYVYVRDLATQETALVSVSTNGQASGGVINSFAPIDLVFSPDSNSLVFGSTATDLTANPPDNTPNTYADADDWPTENLFLRDLSAGTTTLLSVTAAGNLPVQGSSSEAVFSPDGKSVAFLSDLTDLTANGTDFTPPSSTAAEGSDSTLAPMNIFIRDLSTATTTLITATPSGLQSSGLADGPTFSPDGSELAFTSTGTDLTTNPVDPSSAPDSSSELADEPAGIATTNNLFVRDLTTGTTTLVSATPKGMLSNGIVNQLAFSPDGQSIAYTTDASDLTANAFESTPPTINGIESSGLESGTSLIANLFITNLATGTTTLASATTQGLLSNASASDPMFSPDGGSLFFVSTAVDLTSNPPDTADAGNLTQSQGISNLFRYDLATGTTALVSATTGGQLSDTTSMNPFLSPDGQTVYFDSAAPNLTPGNSNPQGFVEIYAATAPFAIANQIQFQSWQWSAQESGGSIAITVERTDPSSAPATVNYAVTNGTAIAGTDFAATSGTLSFAAGQSSATFTVPLISTDRFNGTRTATLVLSNPQGASLGYARAELDLTAQPPVTTAPVPVRAPVPAPVTAKPKASAAPVVPGPVVVNVSASESGRDKTHVVITFSEALDAGAAVNLANYTVTLPGRAAHGHDRHQSTARAGRSVAITNATYDASTHQVTLTLATRPHGGAAYQLAIKGSAGGLTGALGTALNSPGILKPGSDFQAAVALPARRS